MNVYVPLLYFFELEKRTSLFSSYVCFKSGMRSIMGIEDVTKISGAFLKTEGSNEPSYKLIKPHQPTEHYKIHAWVASLSIQE
jgi:hypothetical protein